MSEDTPSNDDQGLWQRLQVFFNPAELQKRAAACRAERRFSAFWLRQAAVVVYALRRTGAEELTRAAAALTYNTLISIVPVLAVAFALFGTFGGLQRFQEPLERLIVENIAVGREEQVLTWLRTFIENINTGAIAGFSVLILCYSAVGLLTNIESTFNSIWGVRSRRPLHVRLAIYWAVLTLSPPLVGISISLTSALQSSTVVEAISRWTSLALVHGLFSLTSTLAIAIALVLTYVTVPDTKVGLREALVGGTLAAVVWTVVKAFFFWVSAGSVKYNAIYGALGLLPLLMIWLYLSWLIVLFGMAYTRAYQTGRREQLTLEQQPPSPAQRERLATLLVAVVARRFAAGLPAPTAERLAASTGAPLAMVGPLLSLLLHQRLLAKSDNGAARYLPARSLASLDLKAVLDVLRRGEELPLALRWDEQSERLREALEQADAAAQAQLEGWSYQRWLAELPAGDEASEARLAHPWRAKGPAPETS